jgi:hypothetical protein
MGNVTNRHILYQQFLEGGAEEASIPAPWIESNQMELDGLYNATIEVVEINEVGADGGQFPPPSLTPV